MAWIIWKIDKKTKIPIEYKRGTDDEVLKSAFAILIKDKENIYAFRMNQESPEK